MGVPPRLQLYSEFAELIASSSNPRLTSHSTNYARAQIKKHLAVVKLSVWFGLVEVVEHYHLVEIMRYKIQDY